MATLATLTADTYELLYGIAQVERPEEDYLKTAIDNDGDTACQFTTPTTWRKGDFAEAVSNGEIIKFREDHPSSGDVNIYKAQRGSTAGGTHAIGDRFYKNPTFTVTEIERAINHIIDNEMWPKVWKDASSTLTHVIGDTLYDLEAGAVEVVRVYQYNINSDDALYEFPKAWWQAVSSLATAVSSTTRALRRSCHSGPIATYC